MPINSGSVLPGDLLVGEQLGQHVFRARRKRDGRELAARIVPPPFTASASVLAAAGSGIRHPALAHIESYGGLDDGSMFIASELVRGPTLLAWREKTSAPELAQILDAMHSLHGALTQAAHAGVLHEAINPRNIRLQPVAAGAPLKLLDLGVPAGAFDQPRDVLAQHFIAPEAKSEGASCTAAANVYACGALLYFLVAAELPDETLSGAGLPAGLRAVIKRALAADPRHRFASVSELDAAVAASTRDISQRMSQPDLGARVSGLGVTPIGLRSSSPPDLLSSYPPDAEDTDFAAEGGSEATPAERRAPGWRARLLPAAAAAVTCIGLVMVVRTVFGPSRTPNQGALAPQSQRQPEPEAPSQGLPLTAKVQIRDLQVHSGAVPASLLKRATFRLQSQFKRCYEQSARAAGHNHFGELSVSLQIDAAGHAHSARVQGKSLPDLDACISQGLASMQSEGPQDTDNMLASFKIAFTP